MSDGPVSTLARPGEGDKVAVGRQRRRPFHTWVRGQGKQLDWSVRRPAECAAMRAHRRPRRDERESADRAFPARPGLSDRRRLCASAEDNWRSRVGRRAEFAFEDRHVAAFRQRDDDGIGACLVVLAELVAKPPGVYANDRIGAAIEVVPLP